MSVAERIRESRKEAGMTLEELAAKAGVSKTYLWELEHDKSGEKKPSAEVLLKIASALSTTIGHLLGLPTVTVKAESKEVELSPSLLEFKERMEQNGTPLKPDELMDLAMIRFRGGQPKTAEAWHQIYYVLASSAKRKK